MQKLSRFALALWLAAAPAEALVPQTPAWSQTAPQIQMAPSQEPVRAYPNPWRSDRHGEIPVVFGSIGDGATVKIFTLSGYLVRSLISEGGRAAWNVKNDAGDPVASGLYLYSITNPGGDQSRGKVAVIR